MKWFILVVIMGIHSDGTQDTYVFTKPVLPTLEDCQKYVYENSSVIRNDMLIEFEGRPIEKVFCIEEKKLEQFFKITTGNGISA